MCSASSIPEEKKCKFSSKLNKRFSLLPADFSTVFCLTFAIFLVILKLLKKSGGELRPLFWQDWNELSNVIHLGAMLEVSKNNPHIKIWRSHHQIRRKIKGT